MKIWLPTDGANVDDILEVESKKAPASVRRKADSRPTMTTAERLRELAVTERTEGFVRHEAEGMLEAILVKVQDAAERGDVSALISVGAPCPAITVVIGLLREKPHGFHVTREWGGFDDDGERVQCLYVSWGDETR